MEGGGGGGGDGRAKLSPYILSANLVPSFVLDQILSGAPLDDVLEKVREYLQQLQSKINEGKVELPLFVITKVCFVILNQLL